MVPASITSFSSNNKVEITGVPLQAGLVARTVTVAVLVGAIRSGITAANTVFVPIDV